MSNIIEDISKITTIPTTALNKLVEKSVWCICDSLEDSMLKDEKITALDIGIGTLYIANDEEAIRYKFIPSEYLEQSVKETVDSCINPLKNILEENLVNKILTTYKTII